MLLYKRKQRDDRKSTEVYEEVAAWDRRRKEAENRGEEFTEPPPTQPQEKSKE